MSDVFSSESQFHRAFENWLRQEKIVFVTTRMDKESTIQVGDPDYWLISSVRPALAIELKMEKGVLSKAQKQRHAELLESGITVHVLRSLQIAIETVYHWLSDVRAEAPRSSPHSLFITKVGDSGDHVVNAAGQVIRRATLTDVKTYERK